MKEIPKIYTLGLLALLVFLVFVGMYALSDSALNRAAATEATFGLAEGDGDWTGDLSANDFAWYEDTAIFICPLH